MSQTLDLLCKEDLTFGHSEVESSTPGDFFTNVTQINSQSDLISMSSFAGPSYLTIRSSVYMILV